MAVKIEIVRKSGRGMICLTFRDYGGVSISEKQTYLRFLRKRRCLNFTKGPVVSVEVMRDRVTGDPRGFAFVVFQESTTVDLVMNEAKHEINHKIVDVKRAQARGIAPPSIHEKRSQEQQQQQQQQQQNHQSSVGVDESDGMGHGGAGGGGGGDGFHRGKPSPEQLHNKVFVGGASMKTFRLLGRKLGWRHSIRINLSELLKFCVCPLLFFRTSAISRSR